MKMIFGNCFLFVSNAIGIILLKPEPMYILPYDVLVNFLSKNILYRRKSNQWWK